jgi:DNA-binding CsgD family transcriptional regulator
MGQALRWLSATVEAEGDHPLARSLIEESVRLLRSQPHSFDLARSLARLGNVAVVQEGFDTAWSALEESVVISRRTDDRWSLATALWRCGVAELHRGRYQRAADWLTEGLALLRDVDYTFHDEPIRAARLFGALAALRERVGLSVMYPRDHERGMAAAITAFGENAFHTAWTTARTMSLAAAMELELEPAAPAAAPELTARETDVLRLVARGMTNEQVAKELFISSRTVNWHLTAVYSKLGLRSRTEATRFALEHGLH